MIWSYLGSTATTEPAVDQHADSTHAVQILRGPVTRPADRHTGMTLAAGRALLPPG